MRQLIVLGFLFLVAMSAWGVICTRDWLRARERRKRQGPPSFAPRAAPQEPVALFALKQAQRMLSRSPADAEALAFLDAQVAPALSRALAGTAGHPGTVPLVLSFEVPEADSPPSYALSAWREAFEGLGCQLELDLIESGQAWRTVKLTIPDARRLVAMARP